MMGNILLVSGLFPVLFLAGEITRTSSYFTDTFDWGEKEELWRWQKEDFPDPRSQLRYCNRYVPSNVCDPDSILKKEEADILDSAIRRLYNDTPCICSECSSSSGGIIMGIAVMKNIFLPYNEHPSTVIREFAEGLRKSWSLGQCENDIIIVLVTGDRLSFTKVGPGISSYISSEETRIFSENKGYFTVGKYYEGLASMIQAYYDLSRSIKFEKEVEEINIGLVSGIVVGVFLLLVLIVLVGCTLRTRLGRPSSFRKDSYDGDPSHSWKRKQPYHVCSTQEKEQKEDPTLQRRDAENNVLKTYAKEPQKANETTTTNDTLLTTVAEIENEDNASTKEDSEQEVEILLTNDGKHDRKLYPESAVNAPISRSPYKGTISNL